jgi:iron complex outermembrane receptor protein
VDGKTSPRAALVWLPDDATSVKLLYGRAFRAPNLYETWFDVLPGHPGRDLEPEEVETVELSASRRLGESLFLSAALYQSTFEGLIEQEVDADGGYHYFNASEARSRGGEVELTAHWSGGARAFASATLQRTRDGAGAPLTNSPERLFKVGLSLPVGGRLRASADATYESSRGTVYGTRTDDFTVVNALLRWQAGERIGVELQVRNLLDAGYAYPGGFEHAEAEIRQDGRSLNLRLSYGF